MVLTYLRSLNVRDGVRSSRNLELESIVDPDTRNGAVLRSSGEEIKDFAVSNDAKDVGNVQRTLEMSGEEDGA